MIAKLIKSKFALAAGIFAIAALVGLAATTPWQQNSAQAANSQPEVAHKTAETSGAADYDHAQHLKSLIPGFVSAKYFAGPTFSGSFKIKNPRTDDAFSCARPLPVLPETSRCLADLYGMIVDIDPEGMGDRNLADTDSIIKISQQIISEENRDVCPSDRMIITAAMEPEPIGQGKGKYRVIPYDWHTVTLSDDTVRWVLIAHVKCVHPHDLFRHWSWTTDQDLDRFRGNILVSSIALRSWQQTGYVETDPEVRKRMGLGLTPHPNESEDSD